MESEKVKEIKKGLEVCNGLCNEACPYHSLGCMNDLSKDSLILINELESENERLANRLEVGKIVAKQRFEKLKKAEHDSDRYKKRITELEEYIKGNAEEAKAFVENWHNDLMKELKHFAERVKMEFYYEFDEIIPSIMSDKIDKILKELIEE